MARPDHCQAVPVDSTVVLYTDGLVEIPGQPLDQGLDALAVTASRFARRSPDELCRALLDHPPGPGLDDKAVIALRTPPLMGYGIS
ncbi:SpoIIE family protein phosphatase [Streptomyces sp. NPDC058377]|uniref:SpoIIE family protein phosphatase n=1 Tax=Streptomyces sp. NPDC058377 TaxID=3346468 RepID=UPI00366974A2